MVAYDYSKEGSNPWDRATWNPRAQIDFMRKMRLNFPSNGEARINQRIALSDTKGIPPRPESKQKPYQVIVQRRTFVTEVAAPSAPTSPPVVGFGQVGTLADAQQYTLAVAPFATILPGTLPSEAHCDVAPTSNASLTLVDSDSNVLCTVTFAAHSKIGTFSWASPAATINAGDILYVIGPSPADMTLAGVNIAFVGMLPP